MSVKDAVKVEERSLSEYLKRAEVYSDRLLDVCMKAKREIGTDY